MLGTILLSMTLYLDLLRWNRWLKSVHEIELQTDWSLRFGFLGLVQRDRTKLRREEVRGGRRREATAIGGGGMQWHENHWPWRPKLVAKLLSFFISGTELLNFFMCSCSSSAFLLFYVYFSRFMFFYWVQVSCVFIFLG